MGIRPSMACIFGIDNFVPDKIFIEYSRERDEYPPPDVNDQGGIGQKGVYYALNKYDPKEKMWVKKQWYDLIWHDDEFGESNVIGYILAKLPYDSQVVRAMALIDEKYLEPGHTIVPATTQRRMINRVTGEKLDVLPQHRYGQGYFDSVEQWIRVTQYLFEIMRMPERYLAPERMKWMLVWQWS